ncbi:metallo-beta-lactamase family protein, RNA-specific [Filimonas lacunae]|nr:metallo-beta-lactamase family protein, RNA-specific [Filimonas lacunae]
MFQGMGAQTESLNQSFGFDAAQVSFVILSHAHIDHSGLLPKLVKEGFKGKIYCTAPTRQLASILLLDSANIQKNTAHTPHGSKEEIPSDPFYDVDDVIATLPLLEVVDYNTWTVLQPGVELLLTDAGHLLGSAAVHLKITEDDITQQVTFSGDIGRYRHPLLCPPQEFPQADYIIMESTYGASLHDPLFSTTDELMKLIQDTCIRKKGKLVIPAFSLGRTQELLVYLKQLTLENRLGDIPVIVDSPLSLAATEIFTEYTNCFNERIAALAQANENPFEFPGLHWTRCVEDSIKIKGITEPAIIIAASGMADAGRIRHHIADTIQDANNTILLVGYCAPGSLGGQLLSGAQEVVINGQEYPVMASVKSMSSMSAHGDYENLCQFLACQEPAAVKKIFLVHGEPKVQEELQKRLQHKGFMQVHIPELHEVCALSQVPVAV